MRFLALGRRKCGWHLSQVSCTHRILLQCEAFYAEQAGAAAFCPPTYLTHNVVTCCCKTGLTLRGGFPTLAVLMPFSDGDYMKQVSYFPGSFHVVTAFAQLLPGVNFLVLTSVELWMEMPVLHICESFISVNDLVQGEVQNFAQNFGPRSLPS